MSKDRELNISKDTAKDSNADNKRSSNSSASSFPIFNRNTAVTLSSRLASASSPVPLRKNLQSSVGISSSLSSPVPSGTTSPSASGTTNLTSSNSSGMTKKTPFNLDLNLKAL